MTTREMMIGLVNQEMDYIAEAAVRTNAGFLEWLRDLALAEIEAELGELPSLSVVPISTASEPVVEAPVVSPVTEETLDVWTEFQQPELALAHRYDCTADDVPCPFETAMAEIEAEKATAEADQPASAATETEGSAGLVPFTAPTPPKAKRPYTRRPKTDTPALSAPVVDAPLVGTPCEDKARVYIRHQIQAGKGIDRKGVADILGVEIWDARKFITLVQDEIAAEQKPRRGRPARALTAAIHQDKE